jgi:hypothetical protein
MSRVPRTNFHSSELVRCLNDLELLAPTDAETAFAQKLALWIHFTDAIPLSAIHTGNLPDAQVPRSGAAADKLAAEFNQAKAMLAKGIVAAFAATPGHTVGGLPAWPVKPPASANAVWLPYRRFYEAQQRELDSRIQPLRARLRAVLANASPRLKKLAELDAMFDKILRGRELELLPRVPLLLKGRFEALFRQHHASTQDTAGPGQVWLAGFFREMQMLLMAEIDLRLQPALGLLEAFKKENTQ